MKDVKWLVVVVAVVAVSFMARSPQYARGQTPQSEVRMAVIDLQRVIDEYQRKKDLEGELAAFKKEKDKDIQKRQREVARLVEEVRELDRRTEAYKAKRWELIQKRALLDALSKEAGGQFAERYQSAIEDVHNDVLTKIERFRVERGLDIILRIDTGELKGEPLAKMSRHLDRKMVLSHRKSLDATEDVIKFVNQGYSAAAK